MIRKDRDRPPHLLFIALFLVVVVLPIAQLTYLVVNWPRLSGEIASMTAAEWLVAAIVIAIYLWLRRRGSSKG